MKNGLKLWKTPIDEKLWNDPLSDWLDVFFERPSYIERSYRKSNVITNDDDYRVQMAVPGLSKDDVKITITDSVMTITHEKKETDNETFYFTNSFKREYTLPNDCNENEITSKLENGILEIVIPKDKKKIKERYIEIT